MMLWWTSLGTNPCFDYTVAIKVRHYLSNLIGTEVWRNKNQPEARLGNLGPVWGQGKFKPKAWTISRPRSLAEPNNQHEKMRKLCRVAHGQTYAGRSAQYSFISRSILPLWGEKSSFTPWRRSWAMRRSQVRENKGKECSRWREQVMQRPWGRN